MSYPIIFETKIIKLTDGRILHCSLEGCNNDDNGRDRHSFIGKIYTKQGFNSYINSLKKENKSIKDGGDFELKINNRQCSLYDYGTHLERMLKRVTTWNELLQERECYLITIKENKFVYNRTEERIIEEITNAIQYGYETVIGDNYLEGFYISKKIK